MSLMVSLRLRCHSSFAAFVSKSVKFVNCELRMNNIFIFESQIVKNLLGSPEQVQREGELSISPGRENNLPADWFDPDR